MRKDRYIHNVRTEIENIKKYISIEQKDKLDFEKLEPYCPKSCIYGLMTGNCFSDEANDLLKKCCKTKTSFEDILSKEPIKTTVREVTEIRYSFSYLEHFIVNYEHNNENIINYIKGKVKKLNLEL